jgi:AcrR family transcriptional regulator
MRRHGWGGAPPVDDDEARRRIVDAAIRCLDRGGPGRTYLSDVATELGVSRPTVYRYFPGMDELLTAVTRRAHETFAADMATLFASVQDPVEFVAESVAYVVERLPRAPHLTVLLTTGRTERFERAAVSQEAIARNVAMLRDQTGVDWAVLGYGDDELTDLVEMIHRMIVSMVVAPSWRQRSGPELRAFIRRWIGPVVAQNRAVPSWVGGAGEP